MNINQRSSLVIGQLLFPFFVYLIMMIPIEETHGKCLEEIVKYCIMKYYVYFIVQDFLSKRIYSVLNHIELAHTLSDL